MSCRPEHELEHDAGYPPTADEARRLSAWLAPTRPTSPKETLRALASAAGSQARCPGCGVDALSWEVKVRPVAVHDGKRRFGRPTVLRPDWRNELVADVLRREGSDRWAVHFEFVCRLGPHPGGPHEWAWHPRQPWPDVTVDFAHQVDFYRRAIEFRDCQEREGKQREVRRAEERRWELVVEEAVAREVRNRGTDMLRDGSGIVLLNQQRQRWQQQRR